MKKKHIDIIVKYFYPVAAGIETNILETYSVLVKKGWSVTVHTSKDTLTEKNCLPTYGYLRGIKIRRYQHNWYGFLPRIHYAATDLIALHNFNIFPHMYIMFFVMLRKLFGGKTFGLILTPHGGYNPEWSIFPTMRRLAKMMYHYTLGVFLINNSVDMVRAVSVWEEKEIKSKRIHKNIVKVIPNGIENEAYQDVDTLASSEVKQAVESYGKYLLQIGRVYPIKNYETTIKALPYLPDDINYVILGPLDYVLGKATYKDYLLDLAKSLGVEKRVIFGGVLRGIDKYYVIKHAQMMVHMALWESFCNVVHEGLSQGLVCIVANNTALPLLIRDGVNGFCLPTKDYKKLADKITYVLERKDSKEIKDMKKRNQAYGLENSWTTIAGKVDTIYKEVVHTYDK